MHNYANLCICLKKTFSCFQSNDWIKSLEIGKKQNQINLYCDVNVELIIIVLLDMIWKETLNILIFLDTTTA